MDLLHDLRYRISPVAAVAVVAALLVAAAAAFLLLRGGESTDLAAVSAKDAGAQKPAAEYNTTETLPLTPPPAPGEVKPTTVALGPECAEVVAPIRALMEEHTSGAKVTLEPKNSEALNGALSAAGQKCKGGEWAEFNNKELLPWMRMPAS